MSKRQKRVQRALRAAEQRLGIRSRRSPALMPPREVRQELAELEFNLRMDLERDGWDHRDSRYRKGAE